MKNHTVLIILLLILTNLSCKDKCSDVRDLLSIRDSQINLRFVDITSGRLLIRDSDGSYTPADVKVFNAAQEEIPFRLLAVNSSGGIKEYSISIPVLMEQGLNYLPREQYGYRVYPCRHESKLISEIRSSLGETPSELYSTDCCLERSWLLISLSIISGMRIEIIDPTIYFRGEKH